MATVNKNFKVKNGLVVEGSTATVNGNNVLVETASDQYIIDLIGGETLVTSVEATQMEVISGELNIKSGVFDASGAAAAAQSAAASDATTKAATAKSEAISAAAADATTKANAAKTAAEATAASALSSAISTEVSNRNTAISTAVDNLVDGAPALLNTLNELAAAINDDANYTTTITTALGTKAPLASPALTGVPTAPTAAANTNTTQIATTAFAKAEADAAEQSAKDYADALTTSDVAEGTAQYFTDARAKASAADLLTGATKTNITITGTGAGLTITAENGVADSTTSDLTEGSNLYFTNARAISATAASYDVLGAAAAAKTAAEATASADATSKANAAQAAAISAAASDATTKANNAKSGAEATASADATSKANAAKSGAEATAAADATSKANAAQAAAISAAAADATTKANAAVTSANGYTDTAISTEVTNRNSAITSAISTEVTNRNTAITTAVAAVVDSAPALLDTLNELAAALGNSPDTITNLTTSIGLKAPLASPALTGVPTAPTAAAGTNTTQVATTAYAKAAADAAQTAATAAAATDATTKANAAQSAATTAAATDATSKANAAQSAAEATASADATTKANAAKTGAEATAAAANTAQENGTTPFTALNINSVAKQVAATLSAPTAGVQTVYSWAKADFRSAEFLVRVGAGVNTEISKVLLTLDTADNIAITEYGIVSTNVALSTVSAAISGSNVELKVTTLNNTSVITVMGTLIK